MKGNTLAISSILARINKTSLVFSLWLFSQMLLAQTAIPYSTYVGGDALALETVYNFVDDSAWVMEREIGSNTVLFRSSLGDDSFGAVEDVFLDDNDNLYLYAVLYNDNNRLADNGLTTADALETINYGGFKDFILKLDSNRDVVYGSYYPASEGYLNLSINVKPDGILEIYDTTRFSGSATATVDAPYLQLDNPALFYTQFDCCAEITENTISPADQTVCINGLVDVITGSTVTVDDSLCR